MNINLYIQSGREEIVELLLKNGAEVNRKNKNDKSPLDIAVEKSFGKIVEILIQSGADINLKNSDGKTTLDVALGNGELKIAYMPK